MFSLHSDLCTLWRRSLHNFKYRFTVGTKSLPAGEYRVSHLTPHVIWIQSQDGLSSAAVSDNADEPAKRGGDAVMTFHRYGESVLPVQGGGHGSWLGIAEIAGRKGIAGREANPKGACRDGFFRKVTRQS
jgi:hypothetical protein